MKINYGVISEQFEPDIWVAGANSKIEYKEVCLDWRPYVVAGERQKMGEETFACVTFGINNAREIQHKFFGNEINFSDRFLAKASGTTKNGNSLTRVAETFRLRGCCTEVDYPNPGLTFDEYYKTIPTPLYAKSLDTVANFDFQYEIVDTEIESLQMHLKQAPLSITVDTGKDNIWKQEVVPPQNGSINHCVTLIKVESNGDLIILDNYNPFIKTLKAGYNVGAALKPVVSQKAEAELWQVGDVIGVAPATPEALIKLMNAVNLPYKLKADGSLDFSSLDIKKTIK